MSFLSDVSASSGTGRKFQQYVGKATKTGYSAATVFRFIGSLAFGAGDQWKPDLEGDPNAGRRIRTGRKHCHWAPIMRLAKILMPDSDWLYSSEESPGLVPTTVSMWLGLGRRHYGGRNATHRGIGVALADRPAILDALIKSGWAAQKTFADYDKRRSDKLKEAK